MENQALGRLLIQGGFLSAESEIEVINTEAKEKNESFLSIVIVNKKLDQGQVANFLAQKFQIPYMDLDAYDISYIPSEVDVKIIEKLKFLPIKKVGSNLYIAVSDPTSNVVNDVKFQTNINNINLVIVEEKKLNKVLKDYLESKGVNFGKHFDNDFQELEVQSGEDEKPTEIDIEDAPVVKFVQDILISAVNMKASDIHFEPYEKIYRVRFRLDGGLFEYKKTTVALREKIASRIKVISNLDISEKRVPQDGRFKLKISPERYIDFRVSILPTLFGEKIVMRILDSSPAMLDVDKLGYDEVQKKTLLNAVKRPYGMVLVTGPTGSGKTISLYSCISVLNKEDINISTAEDPAEINLPGVNQVNMNDKAGLTFAATLKSFLRQDPDVILVGEIRDLETADIAIKAAQTGHLVLSTLHTNDAPKTITRLLNMGVKPFNIASSVILITAQRLVRKLCDCKQKEELPAEVLLEAGLDVDELEGYGTRWHAYRPIGCGTCGGKGYKGRIGVYQVMPITEEIRKIILREGSDIEIATEAKNNGVLGLREAGLHKVKLGVTSLAEVVANTNID